MWALGVAAIIAVIVIGICVFALVRGEPIVTKDKPNIKPPFKM